MRRQGYKAGSDDDEEVVFQTVPLSDTPPASPDFLDNEGQSLLQLRPGARAPQRRATGWRQRLHKLRNHSLVKLAPLGIVIGTMAALSYTLPLNDLLIKPLGEFLDSLHILVAAVLFAVFYIIAVSMFVPRPIMAGLAGFLFGFPVGLMIESPCSLLGASTYFFISKYVFRRRILAYIEGNPKLLAVDRAIEVKGPYLCIMIRLSPLFPFSINNFVISSTSMPYRTYLWSSWFGLIPYSTLYTAIGGTVQDLSGIVDAVTSSDGGGVFAVVKTFLLVLGIVLTVALVVGLSRWSKRAVEEAVEEVERQNREMSELAGEPRDTDLDIEELDLEGGNGHRDTALDMIDSEDEDDEDTGFDFGDLGDGGVDLDRLVANHQDQHQSVYHSDATITHRQSDHLATKAETSCAVDEDDEQGSGMSIHI